MPKLSIIIPVYNTAEYLRKCMESVVNQTLDDIEIICINDCSQDNSLQILQEYADKDNRIKIIDIKENKGLGYARNLALNIATGEYIGFVDSDDYIELNMCEDAYSYAKRFSVDVLAFDYIEEFVSKKRKKIRSFIDKEPKDKKSFIKIEQVFNFKNNENLCFTKLSNMAWSKIYNLDFLKNNNIKFSEFKRGEDINFCISTKMAADKIVYINKALYHYCIYRSAFSQVVPILNFPEIFVSLKQIVYGLCPTLIMEKGLNDYMRFKFIYHLKNTNNKQYHKELLLQAKQILPYNEYSQVLKRFKKAKTKYILQNLFSVRNIYQDSDKLKQMTVLGVKIKFRVNNNTSKTHAAVERE